MQPREKPLPSGRGSVTYHHFARILREGAYQYPDHLPVCEALGLEPDMAQIQILIAEKHGVPTAWTAIGVRATDNLLRRKIIVINGPTAKKKRQFYAIWDWYMDDLVEAIARSGIKLPPDYRMWQHFFFELMPEFLASIREHYPDDLKKILEWFPLAEIELWRWDNLRT